jgi:hypothetical protein
MDAQDHADALASKAREATDRAKRSEARAKAIGRASGATMERELLPFEGPELPPPGEPEPGVE